jgi:hypothetical protein
MFGAVDPRSHQLSEIRAVLWPRRGAAGVEQSYYDSLNDEIDWVSDAAARAFTEEGVRLARVVSAEVGPQFVVEISSSDDDTEAMRIRAEHSAENPKAEASFTHLFDDAEADDRRIAELVRNDPGGEWTAHAPLSEPVRWFVVPPVGLEPTAKEL